MVRKGISLSMTYVVVGLVLLAAAVSVLVYFSGGMDQIEEIVSGETETSGNQLAQNNCLVQMRELCQRDDIRGSAWYREGSGSETATYNGKSCEAYWPTGSPPDCPE